MFLNCKHVRPNNTKSLYSSNVIRTFKPRKNDRREKIVSRVGKYRESKQNIDNINSISSLLRTYFHAPLSYDLWSFENRNNSSRCCSTNRTIYSIKPRNTIDNSPGIKRTLPFRRNKYTIYTCTRPRFLSSLRVSSEDFSSILLKMRKTKYLVIGPGGLGFFALLGVYSSIEQELTSVQEISGSSAGAILALFISLGFSSQEILDLSLDINIKELAKYNIKSFLEHYGLIEHIHIKQKLIELCKKDITFSELPKKLYIAAFNVNIGKTCYFSRDTHPNMSVIDAVCMSISVPFLFSSYKWENNIYIDGGTIELFPAGPFLNRKRDEVLVIKTLSNTTYNDVSTFKDFVNSIVTSTLNNRISYDDMFDTASVDISGVDIFDFNMTYEDKLKLFFIYRNNK